MARIKLTNQAEPDTPDSGEIRVYSDSTTKKLRSKDDTGLVTDYTPGGTDWELPSQGTIDPTNYADNDTVYTHPNHSGEVTSVGDGAQTLASTAISNKTTVTAAATDEILIGDASDSGALKKVTAQTIADLGGGGGGGIENPVDSSWKIRFQEFNIESANSYWGDLQLQGGSLGTIIDTALSGGDENRVGICGYFTGTTGTTYSVLYTYNSGHRFGASEHRMGAGAKLLSLPDATDDFTWYFGTNTSSNGTFGTYMTCIRVDRTVSTTNFVASTRRAGTWTDVDTGIAIDTDWHTFEILVNAANTSHTYYIDGVLKATITTNMPNASMNISTAIARVAGGQRGANIDWMYDAFKPGTARGTIHTWIS